MDVIRGCFLARYHGARQFWVKRCGGSALFGGGGGKLDVILIPSSADSERQGSSVSLPLSPRKGRGEDLVDNSSKNANNDKRRAVLYCNPNAGLVEVATGMGLTGGNVNNDKGDDEKEP